VQKCGNKICVTNYWQVLAEQWVEGRWDAWLRNNDKPKLWQSKYEMVKLA
jgi:hypothetical protein